MEAEESTDIFPNSHFQQSSGYAGYTDYSPYLPTRSSPLRTSTTLYNPTRPSLGLSFNGNDQLSSPPRMAPLSSPIRGYHHHENVSFLGQPPMFNLTDQQDYGSMDTETDSAIGGLVSRFRPVFGSGKPVKRVPFSNREVHLNPFQRGRGEMEKHRRDLFLKKMKESRNNEKKKEREERVMALEFWTDKRCDQVAREREATKHSIPLADLNRTLESEVYESSDNFDMDDPEQRLLREMEMIENEELEGLIEMASQGDGITNRVSYVDGIDYDDIVIDDGMILDFELDDLMQE